MRTVGYFQERLLGLLDHWYQESPLTSAWTRSGPIHVYMRKSPLPGSERGVYLPALTLASLDIKPGSQGKGTLNLILNWMKEQKVEAIKVENVITPEMRAIMDRPKMRSLGWISNQDDPPSYIRHRRDF